MNKIQGHCKLQRHVPCSSQRWGLGNSCSRCWEPASAHISENSDTLALRGRAQGHDSAVGLPARLSLNSLLSNGPDVSGRSSSSARRTQPQGARREGFGWKTFHLLPAWGLKWNLALILLPATPLPAHPWCNLTFIFIAFACPPIWLFIDNEIQICMWSWGRGAESSS